MVREITKAIEAAEKQKKLEVSKEQQVKDAKEELLPFRAKTRDDLVWTAQVAVAAKRFRDAIDCFDALVRLTPEQGYKGMNFSEQEIYVNACQPIMTNLRKSVFTLTSFQRDYLKLGLDQKSARVQEYKITIISRAKKFCNRVQLSIDEEMTKSGAAREANSAKLNARKGKVAMPKHSDKAGDPHEIHISWSKFKADYYRYTAEMSSELLLGDAPVAHADKCDTKALDLYNSAYKECKGFLAPANPVRLGVALNFAVFMYEVMLDQPKALGMLSTAFELGIEALTEQKGEQYQHSTLILEMMNDNVRLWKEMAERK